MKRQLAFAFDPARCFGCGACRVACQQSHDHRPEMAWRGVEKLPPHEGQSDLCFLSWACFHCEDPACLEACPAGAYSKRASDGVVLHDPDKCIGCRYCTWACPYGVPRYDAERGVVAKCDFCVERLEQGEPPACVETCMSGALRFGPLDELEAQGAIETRTSGFPDPTLTHPAVRFTCSPTWHCAP